MIGISAVGYTIGDHRIDNRSRGLASPELLKDKLGVMKVARRGELDTSDLAVNAVEDLVRRHPFDLSDVECLIIITQNPDGFGLPHTSAIVHDKLGLSDRCAAFDISLGCSGYVYGLSAITAFMDQNDMSSGLLITSDPYSKIVDSDDRNTALLFGDAASATLITNHPAWVAGRYVFGSVGKHHEALKVNKNRKLEMNGRLIFTFSASAIPPAIERTLAANKLLADDIDYFLLHQGSKYIVDTIAKRVGIADRAKFHAGQYGNTVSSSLPILLATNVPPESKKLFLAGFGVGLSLGCTVLRRTNNDY